MEVHFPQRGVRYVGRFLLLVQGNLPSKTCILAASSTIAWTGNNHLSDHKDFQASHNLETLERPFRVEGLQVAPDTVIGGSLDFRKYQRLF